MGRIGWTCFRVFATIFRRDTQRRVFSMLRGKITVRETLRVSLKDGIFASIMSGVTEQYFTPFALALGATAPQIGWVSGFPQLFGSLSQLFSVQAVYHIGGGGEGPGGFGGGGGGGAARVA